MSQRLELERELATRLRRVYPDAPEDEFLALITRMADLQLRFEHRLRSDDWPVRGDTSKP